MLNEDIDYRKFVADFTLAVLAGIRQLLTQHGSESYYGIAIYCDSFDGDFGLCVNSEERFQTTLEWYKANYPDAYQSRVDINELKYNCGDFYYQSFPNQNTTVLQSVEQVMKRWQEHVHDLSYNQDRITDSDHQRFDEAGCEVACALESSSEFSKLRRSNNFHFQVCRHDEPAMSGVERFQWWKAHNSLDGFDAWTDFAD